MRRSLARRAAWVVVVVAAALDANGCATEQDPGSGSSGLNPQPLPPQDPPDQARQDERKTADDTNGAFTGEGPAAGSSGGSSGAPPPDGDAGKKD